MLNCRAVGPGSNLDGAFLFTAVFLCFGWCQIVRHVSMLNCRAVGPGSNLDGAFLFTAVFLCFGWHSMPQLQSPKTLTFTIVKITTDLKCYYL